MGKKLNVCLISREFPPDTAFGGISTYSLDTARILKSHGHDVTVFSQSLTGSSIIDIQGIRVHKINVPYPFGSYKYLPLFILAYNYVIMREVMRVHRQRAFDVIDAPDHLAEGLFTWRFPEMPVVTRLHTPYSLLVHMGLNNYRKDMSYWFIKLAEKKALHRSNVLYAPCMDLVRRCDQIFDIGDIPTRIFGYPLDLNLFSPLAENKYSDSLRILFLGRLEQRKGIETMAAAFPGILAQCPGATLTLVGNDTPNILGYSSGYQYLAGKFAEIGCINAVRFVGNLPLVDLPEIFHSHDVVWVPSLYDNFPLICLEAMACGKPVVVSNAGGLPEMVQDGETGLVFEKGNPDELVRQTMLLCSSPELRRALGKRARMYCETNCSDDAIYEKNMELYEYAISVTRK